MECNVYIFEKEVAEYIVWFKSDPSKWVWSGGCTQHGKSILRKLLVGYDYEAWVGVMFRKVKQDEEGKCWTT